MSSDFTIHVLYTRERRRRDLKIPTEQVKVSLLYKAGQTESTTKSGYIFVIEDVSMSDGVDTNRECERKCRV